MKRIAVFLLAALLLLVLPAYGESGITETAGEGETAEQSVFPRHGPYGTGVGAQPGRVVWSYDPDSVEWDGSGYWWETDHFNETVIQRMVNSGIATLAGQDSVKAGWETLFRAHNTSHGRQGGYLAGQKIAIKVNMNGAGAYSDDQRGETHESYTNPVLLRALLVSLVNEAGAAPGDITVYDAGRIIPEYVRELCGSAPLEGVQFRYRDLGGPNDAVPDRDAPVVWSQSVRGETNYLPACVTEADYLINLANLKGHVYGVTLTAKNHFGTIMNSNRMRAPEAAGLHRYLTQNRMGEYTVLVDLMANAEMGEKTMLYLLDAVICAPGESVSITGDNSRWQQAPFNGDYTSSIFFSQDPVAIDSVGADFLMNEPTVTSRNGALRDNPNVENYLHEAGLVSDAPSGTVYLNGKGVRAANLGVHEHWNNAQDKQYGRNLGESEGIELVRIGFSGDGSQGTGTSGGRPAPVSGFMDVPSGSWYEEAVKYCRDNGLMSGTGRTTFSPNGVTSRAMLAAVLHRQAGSPVPVQSTETAAFSDVDPSAWYGPSTAWVAENGIFSGYSDGRFGPGDPITREQLASILWRLSGSPAPLSSVPEGSAEVFADQSSISGYAVDAIVWARENSIISGKNGNRFDPRGLASRAETAAILYRYLSR